jgi:hypothetical protein
MAVLPTGIGPVTGYNIERSLRFNSADSAYLNRTLSAGSTTQWTWSGWVKRSYIGANQSTIFFGDSSSTNYGGLYFTNDALYLDNRPTAGLNARLTTTQVFRDPSAWYHIVAVWDTANATSGDRLRLYVNGVRVTAFSTATYPTQNTASVVNTAIAHEHGVTNAASSGVNNQFDGYLTEVNFIDGQALTPSDFGETDSSTGVWKPKAYTGTYGTNGFELNFSDNSNTTAATLGKDYSGNGNNWTPNNFSVTAGAGNDSLVDSPTSYGTDTGAGGSVRGNYATWNPLAVAVTSSISTLANGNLDVTTAVSGQSATFATISLPSSGKWYWEVTPTGVSAGSYIGIAVFAVGANYFTGGTALFYAQDGTKYVNSANSAYGATYTTNDVIGVAVDVDGGTVTFYKNNSSQGAITYSSGTLTPFLLDGSSSASSSFTANFGQRACAYTAPSGFKALCTTNLPTPTIGATSTTQANDYFNVKTWTATGARNVLTGVGFQPSLIWGKKRSAVDSNVLVDAVRGVTKELYSDATTAETTNANGVESFDSDGFTLVGSGSGSGVWNGNTGATHVAWLWNAGGSNATNTSGTITSTVRANTTSGFSIVTYTSTGSNATVGHGLGVAPKLIIFKNRDRSIYWPVYHASAGATNYLRLNTTNSATSSTIFNDTAPTSTVFSIGIDNGINIGSENIIAYCFAEVPGYSAFGSYTGNGSADGPFVYTNFRPRFIMTRSTSASREWYMYDAARDTYNVATNYLRANTSAAEGSFTSYDMVSNGFKLRSSDTAFNGSGETYIYMAFAESPFKYALAR